MIYLDNSATTRPYPQVVEAMHKALQEQFGNPSSLHSLGFQSEQLLRGARKAVASAIGAKEVIFTSGGTEANNLAILGYLRRNPYAGRHLITSDVEHPSVSKVFEKLAEEGYRVTYLPVSREGELDYAMLEQELCEETALVSVMRVNNEVGCVFDIPRIRQILNEKKSKAVLHSDCVQAFGKIPLNIRALGADMVSLSAHKIHGPKGAGALYVRDGLHLEPLLFGGGQEKSRRSGTENLPGFVGFGKAAELTMNGFEEKRVQMERIQAFLAQELGKLPGAEVHTPLSCCAPHILNISFLGIRSEILLHSLEQKQVYISSGSACASNDKKHRKVLELMGHSREMADSSVRLSISTETTMEEAQEAVKRIGETVQALQRTVRK